jgi:HAD superfamily hydrolase (TIGR01509 family)
MKSIKAVFIDVDGVIFPKINPYLDRTLKKLSNKKYSEILKVRNKYWNLLRIGQISDKEYLLGSNRVKGYKKGIFSELDIGKKHYSFFYKGLHKERKLTKGILKFLKELKSKNIKVFILSNSSYLSTEKPYLQSILPNYVNSSFFSHRVGLAKPDTRFFKYALNKTKLNPEDILFIDDQKKNLGNAIKMNIKTFKFNSSKDFNRILKKIY